MHTTVSFIRTISTIITIVAHKSQVNAWPIGTLIPKSWTRWGCWSWRRWGRGSWDWSTVRSAELRHGQVINGDVSLVAETTDTFNDNLKDS